MWYKNDKNGHKYKMCWDNLTVSQHMQSYTYNYN